MSKSESRAGRGPPGPSLFCHPLARPVALLGPQRVCGLPSVTAVACVGGGFLPVQLPELLLRAVGPQRGLGQPPLQLEQPQAQAAVGRARVAALGRARRRPPGLRGRQGRGAAARRAAACPARPPRAPRPPPGAPAPPPPPDAVPRHQRLDGPGRAGACRGHPPPGGLAGGGPGPRARRLQWQDAQHRQGRLHQDGRPPGSRGGRGGDRLREWGRGRSRGRGQKGRGQRGTGLLESAQGAGRHCLPPPPPRAGGEAPPCLVWDSSQVIRGPSLVYGWGGRRWVALRSTDPSARHPRLARPCVSASAR